MKKTTTFLAILLIAQLTFNLFAQNLSEGFEGALFPPKGWTVINKGDPNGWSSSTSSSFLINGTKSAYIAYGRTAHNDWLIVPRMMPTEGNATLWFYAKNYSTTADLFNVKLSTTGTAEEDFSVLLAGNVSAPKTATKYEYDLSAYEGQNVYVAIQAISTDKLYLSLDDFAGPTITTPNLDAALLSIENSNEFIGLKDIVVTLKNIGTTDLTACNISYSVNGSTPTIYNWTGSLSQDATQQVTIAVGYDFPTVGDYVIEAVVELDGDETALNNTQTKTVNCYGSEPLPFFEGFELGHTSGADLANWWQESISGSNSWTANSSQTTYNRSSRTGNWNAYLSRSNRDWMFSPKPMYFEAEKSYKLSVYARTDELTSATLSLAYGADKNSGAMTNVITANLTNGDYQEITTTFTPTASGYYYLGIKGEANSPSNYLSIDDISIKELAAVDAQLTAISSPGKSLWATGVDNVKVKLRNQGLTDLNAAQIQWSVDGAAQTPYNWTGTLAYGASEEITIGTFDFSTEAAYEISTTVVVTGDGDATNNVALLTTTFTQPLALPFFEGFELGNSSGNEISTWFQQSLKGTSSWVAKKNQSSYNMTPHTGEWNVALYRSSTDWMFSPKPVYLEAEKSYAYSMYARIDEMTGAKTSVAYGTGTNSEAMQNTIVSEIELTNGDYQEITATFTPTTSGYYYIGIKGEINSTPYYLVIDDISIKELSTVDAQLTAISHPKASIWATGVDNVKVMLRNQGLADLNSAQIQWSVDGATQTPYNWTGTLAYGASEEITIGTFDFSTEAAYEISATVVAVGDVDATNNVALHTTTFTEPLALPYFEGFEQRNSNGSDIKGWLQQSMGGTSSWVANKTATEYNRAPRTGEWNASLYNYNTDWMISQKAMYLEVEKSYTFSMYARIDEMTGAKISAAYGTDNNSDAMQNTLVTEIELTNGDYQEITATFTPTASGYYYLGIKGELNSTPYYLSIDDISIKELLEVNAQLTTISYPAKSLWATGVDDVKVMLRNQGVADLNAAQIQWSVDGIAQTTYDWTGTLAYGASEEITIGTFDFGTEAAYEISATVVATGDGDATNNVALHTTTFTEPLALPYFEGFEQGNSNGSTIKGWSQQSMGGTSSWVANKTATNYNRAARTGEWNATLQYGNTDWLFSAKAVHLQADKNYSFSMYARLDRVSGATISVAYGTEAKNSAMLNSIVATTSLTNGDYQKISAAFTPTTSGYYYLGIKGQVDYAPYYLSIDDVLLYSGYLLNYAAGTNGTITGETLQSVAPGANGTAVTAVANDNYHFVKWSDEVTDNPRTDLALSADLSVVAEFALNTYTIAVTADDNGEITPAAEQIVEHGSDISFTITPNAGFYIASVLVDGESVGIVSNYNFNNITGSHSISATFTDTEPITRILTASAGENGSIAPNGAVTVVANENFTFNITANTGYIIKDVKVDGVSVGNVSSYTFENVTAAHSIVAEFAIVNALHFDGTNDYVSFPALPTSIDLSQGFSFTAWVKWDAFMGNERIMSIGNGVNGHSDDILIGTQKGIGELVAEVANGSTNYKLVTGTAVVTTDAWYHVALTINPIESTTNSNVTIYLNGKELISDNTTTPRNVQRSKVWLGRSHWSGDKYFKGSMDEVSFWNKALTKNDIVGILKNEIAGTETGLIGYYGFNQGIAGGDNSDKTTLNDASSFNRNGTLNSFALAGATSNWVVGYESPVQFLTVSTVANGTIIATPNEGIVTGSLIGIETTPAAGYKLVTGSLRAYKTGDESVTVNIEVDSEGNQTFVMPAYDVTLSAAFSLATGFADGNMQMLQLYPNPTKDKVYIKGLTASTWVEVYSMTGEKVIAKTVEVNHSLNLNGLPNGVYLLRIKGQNYKLLLNK